MSDFPLKIYDFIKEDMEALNAFIKDFILSIDNVLIQRILANFMQQKSKRIRPLLFFTILKVLHYEARNNDHIKIAAVIELIHTASLFHDDVIDNNDIRRSKETINLLYGDKIAILLGDYLIAKSFALINDCPVSITKILTNAAESMVKGEILETKMISNYQTKIEENLGIIELKTASLFLALALIAEELTDNHTTEIANYARNIGIAFQLRDDISDYLVEDASDKRKGQDFAEKKATLPFILGYCKATATERKLLETSQDLTIAVKIMKKYGIFKETKEYIDKYTNQALRCLRNFKDTRELKKLALFCSGS